VQRSWVEIDEGRLKENYRVVCEAAGAEVLAVVKANAYGHGLEQCAVALARAGVRWLGVADAAEGGRATRALEAESLAAGSATSPLATREASLGMTELLRRSCLTAQKLCFACCSAQDDKPFRDGLHAQ
jgi:hypothetical protein